MVPCKTTNEQIVAPAFPSDTAVTSQSLSVVQSTPSPQGLFDNILNTFESRFDQQQWLGFKATTAGSLKKFLRKIQDEQKASKSLQNLRRMECFLKAVENLDKLMEEALNMPDIICYIWGPTKILLQVTISDTLIALAVEFWIVTSPI